MVRIQTASLEDHELMRQVLEGDVAAFSALYDRHSAQAFGLAMRVTGRRRAAEEATQDAFLSLWRNASSYDRSRGAVKTWLLSTVHNRCIDWLRREARHEHNLELDDVVAGQLEAREHTEDQVVDREESTRLRQLLASLPADQRQAIELAYFDGLTQSEIAATVNIPLGTVKGRQRLALRKLQRTLTEASSLALTTGSTAPDGLVLAG